MNTNPALLGSTAGITTAALAAAAHGAAGGGVPTGPASALLVAVAAGVGIVGAYVPTLPPIALLTVGQLGTHAVLSALTEGHPHTSGSMFAAHLVAVAGCAVLLVAAARLFDACSTAIRAVTLRLGGVHVPASLAPTRTTDPLVWGRAPPAISRRGPPVAR
ncbi:hypothetical protein [Rhodococcus sp. (in: high G+C Gram-positive bacteria)]|uniref:hypothetical protein n=1 Tax=Rhodococcus sp. TaxID=1831 RepID=UPI00388FD9A6